MKEINVACYGGAFDPLHAGHMFTVCYLASIGKFDNIFVIPVAKHAYNKSLCDFNHRYEMCRLALNWIPKTHVSDIEQILLDDPNHPEVNYTYFTLKKIKALHPDWNLHFVIGADVAPSIPDWKYGKELLSIAEPYILGRHGYENGQLAVLPDISSTQIRDSLKNDPKHVIAKTFLTNQVYEYIIENKLFV